MTKILIVAEDTVLQNTKEILESEYDLICVSTCREALDIFDEEMPDLVLTDVCLPDSTGADMYKEMCTRAGETIPIMYMMNDGNEEAEAGLFDQGASDLIRKPFRPDVLKKRIANIIHNIERIKDLTEEATIDKLTGFLNRSAAIEAMSGLCERAKGVLIIVDLDSFKPVNDIYGHEKGDSVLMAFSDLIRSNMRPQDTVGRIGGDEFIMFLKDIRDESGVASLVDRLNKGVLTTAYNILGRDMSIPIGISAGAVFVPEYGTEYRKLFTKADKALYLVKQNGKHGYAVYNTGGNVMEKDKDPDELKRLSMIFEERNSLDGALWLGKDAFSNVYHFLVRYIQSYNGVAYKILFTLLPSTSSQDPDTTAELCQYFGDQLSRSLRKSDIMMQNKQNQFFLLLPDINDEHIQSVVERITKQWKASDCSEKASIICETELLIPEDAPANRDNRRHFIAEKLTERINEKLSDKR